MAPGPLSSPLLLLTALLWMLGGATAIAVFAGRYTGPEIRKRLLGLVVAPAAVMLAAATIL